MGIERGSTPLPGFHVIFRIYDEPESVVMRYEAPDCEYVIDIVEGWIEAGLVPVTMPNGCVWLLPASAIEEFAVEAV